METVDIIEDINALKIKIMEDLKILIIIKIMKQKDLKVAINIKIMKEAMINAKEIIDVHIPTTMNMIIAKRKKK